MLMAKAKKKKRKLVLPNKKLLIVSGAVLMLAVAYGTAWLLHNHEVTADRTRFAKAGNEVEMVADAIVTAVGQPADRKDGGKCSYAHQEFTKGSLSCEVYAYLTYGVGSPDDVNTIVQKIDPLPALHGSPWQFKAVTEKPHQFIDGVNYSDNFVPLSNLFDTETRTVTYKSITLSCSVSFLYHNSLASIGGYPNLKSTAAQAVLIDVNCSGGAKGPYFLVID